MSELSEAMVTAGANAISGLVEENYQAASAAIAAALHVLAEGYRTDVSLLGAGGLDELADAIKRPAGGREQ